MVDGGEARGGCVLDAESRSRGERRGEDERKAKPESTETAEIWALRWRVCLGFEGLAEGFEFCVAAVVAGLGDQGFGFEEVIAGFVVAGHGEVVVGEVKTHAGSCGDAEDFVEVVRGAAGEES